MKFSRQKMQHLKWVRRKELIRINCFIMIAILLMVLLFMGFPIVSNAEESSVPSGYVPLVTQYPDFNFDNMITQADFDILYPDDDINNYVNCLFNEEATVPDWFSRDYFDGNLDNGEIFIDSALLSQEFKCYVPHYVESGSNQGRIDRYDFTGTTTLSSLPNLVLGYSVTSGSSLPSLCFFSNNYKLYSCKNTVVSCTLLDVSTTANGQNPSRMSEYEGYKCRTESFVYNGHTCYCFKSNNTSSNAQIGYPSTSRYSANYTDSYGYTACDMMVSFPTDCRPICCCCVGSNDRVYLTEKLSDNADQSVVKFSDGVYSSDVWGHDSRPVRNVHSGGGDSARNHEKPYEGSCVYMQYSNLNTGNMHIVVKSDEYQKSQNASIKLKCFVSAQVSQNAIWYKNNVGDQGSYDNNFSVPNEVFNLGTYVEYEIPLSSFNSSGDYSISLEDINKGLWNSNEKTLYSFNSCFENNSSGLSKSASTLFFSLVSVVNYMPNYDAFSDFKYNLDNETWDVQGVFCIGDSEEIFDSFTLDVISGSINNQDYALPNEDDIKDSLNTPTVPNNYVPQPYAPYYPDATNITVPNSNTDVDNDNSNNNNVNPTNNNDVTNGDYSPSVINNNNVTVTQGNKYPEKGVMQSFVRIINNDKNNTVNDIDTLIGGSSYIQLMNNALVAVPDQVWSIWITALKAILGIAVSAFFLKILINWAT